MKIAIFQNGIPHYRIAFFEGLASNEHIDLTIYVFEPPKTPVNFSWQLIDKRAFGNFVLFKTPASIGDYDCIIMTFNLYWLNLYSLLLTSKRTVILWGHGMGKNKWLGGLRAKLIKRADGFIAYEPKAVSYFQQRGIHKNHLAYQGNTVLVENSAFSEQSRDYFLYVGRLQERKQIGDILEALSMLDLTCHSGPILKIVGDGDLRNTLYERAVSYGLQHKVEFIQGTTNTDELKTLFSSALAYVSPGHVGLGVLHAFSYGVPVITYRNKNHAPEVENIVDGENGDLLEENINCLSDALRQYLENQQIAIDKGRKAFEWYSGNRTMSLMIQRYLNAIEVFVQ